MRGVLVLIWLLMFAAGYCTLVDPASGWWDRAVGLILVIGCIVAFALATGGAG